MSLTLVLGARRSGKSAAAEEIAAATGERVVYVAPLTVADAEMARRVAVHRARRPQAWATVETQDPLAALHAAGDRDTVLLDSLGTWVSEVLWRAGALDGDGAAAPEAGAALAALAPAVEDFALHAAARPGATVVVAEEAGWGPAPPSAGTRLWLDAMGDAARACSRRATRAVLVVAGRLVELP